MIKNVGCYRCFWFNTENDICEKCEDNLRLKVYKKCFDVMYLNFEDGIEKSISSDTCLREEEAESIAADLNSVNLARGGGKYFIRERNYD